MSIHPVRCAPRLRVPADAPRYVSWRAGRLNAAPVVVGTLDLGHATEGHPVAWTKAQLLATVSGADIDDALSVVSVSVSFGSVQDNGGGTWTFTPPAGFDGDVSVTVTITDGTAINPAPGTVAVHSVAAAAAAWKAGTEWNLDAGSPYHPQNGETGATFGYFTPFDLGVKLRRWWDAFDTSRITSSGLKVSAWADRVANVAVTRDGSSVQPNRVSGIFGINGRPVIAYDGGDGLQRLSNTGLPTGRAARGQYVIYRPDRYSGSNTITQQGTNTTAARFALQFRTSPAGDPYFTGWAQDLSSGDAIGTSVKTACVHWAGNGGLMRIWKNGTLKASGNIDVNTREDRLYFGSGPGAEFMLGGHGDAVFTDGSETDDEIRKVIAWMHWKYGIQAVLPANDPSRTARPLARE